MSEDLKIFSEEDVDLLIDALHGHVGETGGGVMPLARALLTVKHWIRKFRNMSSYADSRNDLAKRYRERCATLEDKRNAHRNEATDLRQELDLLRRDAFEMREKANSPHADLKREKKTSDETGLDGAKSEAAAMWHQTAIDRANIIKCVQYALGLNVPVDSCEEQVLAGIKALHIDVDRLRNNIDTPRTCPNCGHTVGSLDDLPKYEDSPMAEARAEIERLDLRNAEFASECSELLDENVRLTEERDAAEEEAKRQQDVNTAIGASWRHHEDKLRAEVAALRSDTIEWIREADVGGVRDELAALTGRVGALEEEQGAAANDLEAQIGSLERRLLYFIHDGDGDIEKRNAVIGKDGTGWTADGVRILCQGQSSNPAPAATCGTCVDWTRSGPTSSRGKCARLSQLGGPTITMHEDLKFPCHRPKGGE